MPTTDSRVSRDTPAGGRYAAIGASDSFGVGTADPDRQSWPTVLAGLLVPAPRLLNLGIPGETVARALENELPVALDAQPRYITVWLGVNDLSDGVSLEMYRRQLLELVAALRTGTDARIVVGNLPDHALLPAFAAVDSTALRAQVVAWNAAIEEVCAAEGVGLVDVFAGWSELADHPEYISADGLHPSALGARRLAALFAAALVLQPAPPRGP
jgi:lysophospholipase L1-like esterase